MPIAQKSPKSAPSAAKNSKRSTSSTMVKLYLALYNFISLTSWSYYGFKMIHNWSMVGFSPNLAVLGAVCQSNLLLLQLTQSLAILEILHAAVGFVAASPITTALQVVSRTLIVWGPLYLTPIVAHPIGIVGCCLISFAWTITEIVRYSFYELSLWGLTPSVLTWLRYSLFLVLYPLGVAGEISCIAAATILYPTWPSPLIPKAIPFLTAALYGPGFYVLFGHMLKQRSKVLGGVKPTAASPTKAKHIKSH